MHAFPSGPELQFLVGRKLETVCVGSWLINLGFGRTNINVEGALEHTDQNGIVRLHNTEETRRLPLCLHQLLGQSVCDGAVDPFCLTLSFTNGDSLRVFSDEGPYECGQIYDEQGEVTVF
jgi:hypothetical protein